MIPEEVKESMAGPIMAVTATRDANLRPTQVRVFESRVHPDLKTVTCFIAECNSAKMIENLEANGRITLTVSNPTQNDSYQLKGNFVSWRRNSEEDDSAMDGNMAQFREVLHHMGMPEEMIKHWNLWTYKPGIAVTFEVDAVFGQAPGPDTGQQIS